MNRISSPVGVGGKNLAKDAVRIQALLNMVPPELGGPAPKLKQDDICGPKTIAAIKAFQRRQFGDAFADGRIDPSKRTENRLHELEGSPQTAPLMFAQAARFQALQFAKAGAGAIRDVFAPDGTPVPRNRAQAANIDAVLASFNLVLHGTTNANSLRQRTATADDGRFLREKFNAMEQMLLQPGLRYVDSQHVEKFHGLKAEGLRPIIPVAGTAFGVSVDLTFCEPDDVNQLGFGPMTRAALVLQATASAVDRKDRNPFTANRAFLMSGFVPADMALHMSAVASRFCQLVATRNPGTFFCVEPGMEHAGLARL